MTDMSDEITDDAIVRLLENSTLDRIEKAIAAAVGRKILPPTVGILSTELFLAGLTESRASDLLAIHEQQLIRFGIELFRSTCKEPFSGDYAPGEEGQQKEAGNTVILGIGHGFGLTYLCYFSFLTAEDYVGFERYAKARRLAGAKKFLNKLKRIYACIQAA